MLRPSGFLDSKTPFHYTHSKKIVKTVIIALSSLQLLSEGRAQGLEHIKAFYVNYNHPCHLIIIYYSSDF